MTDIAKPNLSRFDITGPRFETQRRGYDPQAVDRHLARVAEAFAELQTELGQASTDQTALDLLKSAERTARDTKLGAEIDANRIRATATNELEEAQFESAQLVEQARAEAAQILDTAKTEAEHIVGQAANKAAAIERGAHQQAAALEQKMQDARRSVRESAADLRLGAGRLAELAEFFEAGATTAAETNGTTGSEPVIDLREPTPPQAPKTLFGRGEAGA